MAPSNLTSPPPEIIWTINNTDPTTLVPYNSYPEWQFSSVIDQDGLPNGVHVLNVTVTQVSQGYPFYLLDVRFRPSDKYWDLAIAPSAFIATDEGADSTQWGGNSTQSQASGSSTQGAPEASGSTSRATSAEKKAGPPTGAVVGGVIGGVVFLVLVCAALVLLRRRRQHKYASLSGTHDDGECAWPL